MIGLPQTPSLAELDALVEGEPKLRIDGLRAGYGQMEILHDVSLRIGGGQSLGLIGPNGAGKSTVLHSIFGFTRVMSGSITVDGRDVTGIDPSKRLKSAGIAYVLRDNSVFPDMSVEENLWMGGYLKPRAREAHE